MTLTDQSITNIAKQFGIRISELKKIKTGVYQVATPSGKAYSLKRMPIQLARLRWIDRILQRVRNNYPYLVWRNRQMSEGRRIYVVSQQQWPYVLTPWVTGRMPSPLSLSDMRACGVALARFHLAGRAALSGEMAYSEIGTWHTMLLNKHRFLQRKIAEANMNVFSPWISRFLQKHSSEILHYSNQSRALLRNSGYSTLRQSAHRNAVLCHGDGGPSNYILNAKGTYLIDFETLHVNLRAYDLYRVIYNSCKDYQWNFAIARAILNGYRELAKLQKTDYELFRVWLRFPHTTYLVLRPCKVFPFTKKWLQLALSAERAIGPFLQKLNNYAAQHSS